MKYDFVYVLFSRKDREFYIGLTSNLKGRLGSHRRGEVASTRFRRPLTLLHYEAFINSEDARAREQFLKSGAGHRQLKAKLKRTLSGL